MRELPARCDFCYRPARVTLVQRRRKLWQVAARKPLRRVSVCDTWRCRELADARLYVRLGGLL